MHQFFKFTTNALMMKRVFNMAGYWPVLILRFSGQKINRALKFPKLNGLLFHLLLPKLLFPLSSCLKQKPKHIKIILHKLH